MNMPLRMTIMMMGLLTVVVAGVVCCATVIHFGLLTIPMWFIIAFLVFFLEFTILEWGARGGI